MNISFIFAIPLLISNLILLVLILISTDGNKGKMIRIHNCTIYYDNDFDKRINIIKLQRKMIFKMKVKLYFLKFLYNMKGIFE